MSGKPHNTPTEATAEQGEVMLDGPAGLAVSFTAEAAAKSAVAMASAADEAHRQIKNSRRR